MDASMTPCVCKCLMLHFAALVCLSHNRLAAENLFLRKQLAFYVERKARPRRLNNATRIALVVLIPHQPTTAPDGSWSGEPSKRNQR